MLAFDDPRWTKLEGGYRVACDPRPALQRLERSAEVARAWEKLWQDLYHQGDVGVASYAAVPHVVRVHDLRDVADWNTFALIGSIELARSKRGNPDVPPWLADGYERAWRDAARLALRDLGRSDDAALGRAALGVLAIARGQRAAGSLLLELTDDELREWLDERDED